MMSALRRSVAYHFAWLYQRSRTRPARVLRRKPLHPAPYA